MSDVLDSYFKIPMSLNIYYPKYLVISRYVGYTTYIQAIYYTTPTLILAMHLHATLPSLGM
jgi:hypothetical protein